MSRPPYKAPTGAGRRTAVAFVAIIIAFAIIAYAVAFWPRDDDEPPNQTSPAAVAGDVVAGALIVDVGEGNAATGSGVEPAASRPTVPVLVGSPPATTDASFRDDCEGQCLVRLVDGRRTDAALADKGLRAAFAAGGHVWAGMTAADVADLRATGMDIAIVDESAETLRLYAVRTPQAGDDTTVRTFGEIVDAVGNQYIVRVPQVPASVTALTSVGIWVEKFPPLPPARIEPRGDAELDPDLLWKLSGTVSTDEIYATMADLQGMGAADGGSVGSRYYTTTGNAMAAEYLYRRFEAYDLDVRYEDFVTDDGLLALNIVAELPGRDPSQVYLVMGHFDSMNSGGNNAVAPGADDNATGVAGMLEIARVMAGYDLEHPVRFFATNVEEVGLQGVQAFASAAAKKGQTISAAFNLDALGSPYQGSQIILNADRDSVELRDFLVEINDAYELGQDFLLPPNAADVISDDTVMRDWGFPTVLLARELFGWNAIHHSSDDVVENVDLYNVRMATELVLIGTATLLTEGGATSE